MRLYFFSLLFTVTSFCFPAAGTAQNIDAPVHPSLVGTGTFLGISPPLRDLPVITETEYNAMIDNALRKAANKKTEPRLYPFSETALPQGPDAVWQNTMGKYRGSRSPLENFEGQTTASFPPDCNGTAGPNHYMQTVNATYAIYNKTGTKLAGPTNLNLLFGSVAGSNCNDGDPLIQYDEQAGRWVAVEFSICGSNDLMLIAVSTTNDPTGTWYQYSFDVADIPDYEKIGVWQDGYYMGTNNGSGKDIYVFERSKMLQGLTAQMVGFDNAWRPGAGFLCVPPLDNDGPAAPAGTPGMFIAFNDDAVTGGSDQLWLYELVVNWTTPASSTFTRSQQINVTAFDSQFTSSWNDITQPTSQKLDGVPQVIMNAPQYRNFGTYQTIVCCHTVDVDATNHAGIRWYELRKTPPETTWVIRQQSTYAPDDNSRWMGSIMLNGSGRIALGYSISGSSTFPGIRYCGQSAAAYSNGSGELDIAEDIIHNGTVAQTTYNRWGDYALLSVDPVDDQTFWFTSQYVKTGGTTKGTKIASFKIVNAPVVSTLAASSVTLNSAQVNGTVNPGGLETTYYFQWGTTAGYGNATAAISAGSGTAALNVNTILNGLSAGTTYHFRLVASNCDGTSYGNDITFNTLCNVISLFPWSEGFENGGLIPGCWTQQQINNSGVNWTFITGNGGSNPATAHTGTYNACLKDITSADNKTMLITPPLNLVAVLSPQIKFWHTQVAWTGRQDQLEVYYKTSMTGSWTFLASYTSNVTTWTQRTISLPNATGDYYIAFQGNAKYGRGICIDDVEVSSACTTVYPVSVIITASANPVGQGIPVTFTASGVNGGTSPVYQWVVNSVNSGTNQDTFTYVPVNGDVVSCTMTSSETCAISNPANSNIIIVSVNSVPYSVGLNGQTVTGTECYNAEQTITVAGNDNFFTVLPGGSVTMIAGENILFYPGTAVAEGGYLFGYIMPDGPWCPLRSGAATTVRNDDAAKARHPVYSIYPNPANDKFTLELKGEPSGEKWRVEIYTMTGKKILSFEKPGKFTQEYSLTGLPAGVYLIRVAGENKSGTTKIVKQ